MGILAVGDFGAQANHRLILLLEVRGAIATLPPIIREAGRGFDIPGTRWGGLDRGEGRATLPDWREEAPRITARGFLFT